MVTTLKLHAYYEIRAFLRLLVFYSIVFQGVPNQ